MLQELQGMSCKFCTSQVWASHEAQRSSSEKRWRHLALKNQLKLRVWRWGEAQPGAARRSQALGL